MVVAAVETRRVAAESSRISPKLLKTVVFREMARASARLSHGVRDDRAARVVETLSGHCALTVAR